MRAKRRKFPLLAALVGIFGPSVAASADGPEPLCRAGCKARTCRDFVDDFETDKRWTWDEELVGEDAGPPHCYATGVGYAKRLTTARRAGELGLSVFANASGSHANDHVIGHVKLDEHGQTGQLSYEVMARIDPTAGFVGQVGPEISVQNTVQNPTTHAFETVTAGFQYVASSYVGVGTINMWTTGPKGGVWKALAMKRVIPVGSWAKIRVDFDLVTRRYIDVVIDEGGAVTPLTEARQMQLGVDVGKFKEEAFWITLESQNLWNNCQPDAGFNDSLAVTRFAVSYDDVALRWLHY